MYELRKQIITLRDYNERKMQVSLDVSHRARAHFINSAQKKALGQLVLLD